MLQRDRAEDASLVLDRHALLGLDGGLEAVGPLPFVGDAARRVVHELHLAPAHDVVDVSGEQALGVEGVAQPGEKGEVLGIVEAPLARGPPRRARDPLSVRAMLWAYSSVSKSSPGTKGRNEEGEAFEVGRRRRRRGPR